ncbi:MULTISPECIES: hypothetical protein [unclassified Brevundimonas]|uniref:hypothetical protein n=1 Tax=unclassified Brevundimonas TaxID=2622653 RepID=UPI002006C951|nr:MULTISPECIES: hypothetical protein [unclassified Brevundimonas]MCK6105554.1 hypothetical protein [Brevundimonas sp. EYE_349]
MQDSKPLVVSILVLLSAVGVSTATVAQVQPSVQTAPLPASVQDAWVQVRAALTPAQQANAVRGFLSALAAYERRPTLPPMDARDIASGRAVSLDDPALLQRPQAHEVTITVGGQFLVFRPLSRASLEPLFGR